MPKTPEQQAQAALNYLIGQVMAKTQGRANPHVVRQMILDRVFGTAPDPPNPVP